MPDTVVRKDDAASVDAVVIGGGPAGLMAADVLSAGGADVLLAEAKPSIGRKFLMAGKSGLNITFDAPIDDILLKYGDTEGRLAPMLCDFGPSDIRDWAAELGQTTFVGSSGRVFPSVMKASPLLRAWIGRLEAQGVTLRTRWRWQGWSSDRLRFETPGGVVVVSAGVVVFALGGASWARLGSDGAWASGFADRGVPMVEFKPSNAGLHVSWSNQMQRHFGAAVKGTVLIADDHQVRGEFVVSQRGMEGGGIYAVFSQVRDGAALALDLLPDRSEDDIANRLAGAARKDSRSNRLRKTLRLDPVRLALLNEFGRPLPGDADLPRLLKHLPVRHDGPRPMDEAISTAGGVGWDGVDADLMLNAVQGAYVAGEMLDWEAPTGGYLLTACLATGRWAGHAALRRLQSSR